MAHALSILLSMPSRMDQLMKMNEPTIEHLFRTYMNDALAHQGQNELTREQDKLVKRVESLQKRTESQQKIIDNQDKEIKRLKAKLRKNTINVEGL
jgi:peptidoglycan hydrolase CwlO-like protein